MRRLAALFVLLSLLLAGCGGGSSEDTATGTTTTASASAGASADSSDAAAACPTTSTKSFAKTRFVADVGGAAFLVRRYIYQPYQAQKFQKGAAGRRLALLKAAGAAAASVKLLRNASENAKADPTLCKTVAGPLSSLTSTLSGLTSSLGTGSFSPALVGGLGGAVGGLLDSTSKAGVEVTEQPTDL